MSAERDPDSDATVKIPRPVPQSDSDEQNVDPNVDQNFDQNFDPEKTLVREDWESTVIRRVAPRVAQVQSEVGEDSGAEARFGWESEGLRRLSQEVQRAGK